MFEYEGTPEEKLQYKEELLSAKETQAQEANLDMGYAGWKVTVPNIDELPNEQYAMLRRGGFGGSDSSILLGVNPYTTITELIEEKARDYLTEEEKAVGNETAVRKGRDLEPLIISKFERYFGLKTVKPKDMYRCVEHPYLTMNFDGITGNPDAYLPVEIKVVTAKGERHYNPRKAIYIEGRGFHNLPEDVSQHNISIQNKAAHYGIPPYYYTQLQQEIMASGAHYGYLNTLYDSSWIMHTYFVWRDDKVIRDIVIQGYRNWQRVIAKNPARALG